MNTWQQIDENVPREIPILVKYNSDVPFVATIHKNKKIQPGMGVEAEPYGLRSDCGCSIQDDYVNFYKLID